MVKILSTTDNVVENYASFSKKASMIIIDVKNKETLVLRKGVLDEYSHIVKKLISDNDNGKISKFFFNMYATTDQLIITGYAIGNDIHKACDFTFIKRLDQIISTSHFSILFTEYQFDKKHKIPEFSTPNKVSLVTGAIGVFLCLCPFGRYTLKYLIT